MPCIINAESGTGLTNSADGSGLLKVQSGGKTTNALAWVNFNGTGTVAIRSSYNVSSITDNGVGDYTVNFATALSDANYVACGVLAPSIQGQGGSWAQHNTVAPTTSAYRMVSSIYNSSLQDSIHVNAAFFGN